MAAHNSNKKPTSPRSPARGIRQRSPKVSLGPPLDANRCSQLDTATRIQAARAPFIKATLSPSTSLVDVVMGMLMVMMVMLVMLALLVLLVLLLMGI